MPTACAPPFLHGVSAISVIGRSSLPGVQSRRVRSSEFHLLRQGSRVCRPTSGPRLWRPLGGARAALCWGRRYARLRPRSVKTFTRESRGAHGFRGRTVTPGIRGRLSVFSEGLVRVQRERWLRPSRWCRSVSTRGLPPKGVGRPGLGSLDKDWCCHERGLNDGESC